LEGEVEGLGLRKRDIKEGVEMKGKKDHLRSFIGRTKNTIPAVGKKKGLGVS